MKKVLLSLLLFWQVLASGQNQVLSLNLKQAETLFINQNLELIAEKLNIDVAEAAVIQAKVWPNPHLQIGEINFWKNGHKHVEELPPLFNDWGKYTQISVELEQLIETAGKRKKRLAVEKVNASMSRVYFEEVLRDLKQELRLTFTALIAAQNKEKIYQELLAQLQHLLLANQQLLTQKDVSKSDFVRLQSLEISYKTAYNQLLQEKNEQLKTMRTLLSLPSVIALNFEEDSMMEQNMALAYDDFDYLLNLAYENRSDLKFKKLEKEYFNKQLIYEKSQRVPDLTFSVAYDRGGSIMRDFIGFGIAFDLPIFDRNQSAIKIANIQVQQSELAAYQKKLDIENELKYAFQNFQLVQNNWQEIDVEFEQNLEQLLPLMQQNYLAKNINLLQYIDFLDAYIEGKNSMIDLKKQWHERLLDIQYIIEKDFN